MATWNKGEFIFIFYVPSRIASSVECDHQPNQGEHSIGNNFSV